MFLLMVVSVSVSTTLSECGTDGDTIGDSGMVSNLVTTDNLSQRGVEDVPGNGTNDWALALSTLSGNG